VLLVWARERRRFFPLEHAHRLATLFPDAAVEIIEDSGPFVTEDQPRAVATAIRLFIDDRVMPTVSPAHQFSWQSKSKSDLRA
jgi:pimeloyl-ACP methyl ester carboxylesterase